MQSESDLHADAIQAGTEELLGRAGVAYAAHDNWRDGLRAVAYEMLAFLEEDDGRARLMVLEAPEAGERAREIREQGIEGLTELIDLGRQAPGAPAALDRTTAEITAGVIYNRLHVAVQTDRLRSEGARMVPELMYSAVLPYLGVEAALEELAIPAPSSARSDPTKGASAT